MSLSPATRLLQGIVNSASSHFVLEKGETPRKMLIPLTLTSINEGACFSLSMPNTFSFRSDSGKWFNCRTADAFPKVELGRRKTLQILLSLLIHALHFCPPIIPLLAIRKPYSVFSCTTGVDSPRTFSGFSASRFNAGASYHGRVFSIFSMAVSQNQSAEMGCPS